MKYGYFRDPIDNRDYSFYSVSRLIREEVDTLPKKVSYRTSLSPVKNQGNLGSCVAFASVALKEWQEQKENVNRNEYDLSEKWVYWNCKEIDGYPNSEGTTIRSSMKILNKQGVPPEKAWPYETKKENIGSPEKWAYMISKWNLISEYRRIENLTELKESLASNGPVVGGVLVFDTFYYPKNGIIDMPIDDSKVLGGHAILLCGYDDEKQLIEFKNSWSDRWGDGGFGYLPYQYIKKYCIDMWSCIDQNVTIQDLVGNIKKYV